MNGLILAAGMGNRLNEISETKPKILLEVSGRTILDRMLSAISVSDITDVVIVVGHCSELVMEIISNCKNLGFSITCINNRDYAKTNNIYSVHIASEYLKNKEFVLFNGDLLFQKQILTDLTKKTQEITLVVDTTKELGCEEMKIKLARTGQVIEITKEMNPETADGEYIGMMKFKSKGSNTFFNAVKETIENYGKDVFYESALQHLIRQNFEIYSSKTNGQDWIEIDTKQDLSNAERMCF